MLSIKKNFIWTRDPAEAYQNPYEYDAQKQFSRESSLVLKALKKTLESFNGTFTIEDTSLEKAVWMLQLDAVDTLIECGDLLHTNNHKIAGRLFRDVMEVLDLAAFFMSKTDKSKNCLKKWYKDEVIPHREYRNYINRTIGAHKAEELSKIYRQLSNFTHRTYRSLAYGYIRGRDYALVYDGFMESGSLVFPGVISMYYSLLANFIIMASNELERSGLIHTDQILLIWSESIEANPEERRFAINFPKKPKEDS